jgi:hypothetical protein
MEIIKKAWSLGNDLPIEEDFVRDFVYLGTRGQARDAFWRDYEGIEDSNGDEIEYLNISMVRAKFADIVKYKGEEKRRWQVESDMKYESRMSSIENSSHKYFLVQDSRTYIGNAVVWWAIGGNGYTSDPMKAHRYSKAEITSTSWRDTDIFVPFDIAIDAIKVYCDTQLIPNKERL